LFFRVLIAEVTAWGVRGGWWCRPATYELFQDGIIVERIVMTMRGIRRPICGVAKYVSRGPGRDENAGRGSMSNTSIARGRRFALFFNTH